MAISQVQVTTKFRVWKDIINEVIDALGDNTALDTTAKDSLVNALNEVNGLLGDLTTLNTTAQDSIVNALNEVLTELGDVANLNTDTKVSSVAAINELLTEIGNIGDLATTTTTNLVLAVNGMQGELDTAEGAISTLDGNIGVLSNLDTTEQGSLVGAVNEVDGNVGDLTTLDTTEQGSLVGAINEVIDESSTPDTVQYTNLEPNGGRYASEGLNTIAVTTFATTGTFIAHNSASFAQGDNFINDNSNFGGAGGSLGTDISTLVSALGTKGGRTNQRYGYEFYINDITMGANTQDAETYLTIDYHPFMVTNNVMLGKIGSVFTFMCWIKLKTLNTPANNGILLGDAGGNVTTYIDGVQAGQQSLLTTGDGWVHLKQVVTLDTEFYQFFPAIFANDQDVVQIALPVTANTNRIDGMHVGLVN